jgi:Cu/Ag efflux protein CusF
VATWRVLWATAALTAVVAGGVRAEDPANIYPFAAGTIKTMDSSGKLLTVVTAKGTRTFGVTERTYIYRGKEKLTSDKLKIGDSVKINYFTNETGQAFIRRLKVQPPLPPEERPAP